MIDATTGAAARADDQVRAGSREIILGLRPRSGATKGSPWSHHPGAQGHSGECHLRQQPSPTATREGSLSQRNSSPHHKSNSEIVTTTTASTPLHGTTATPRTPRARQRFTYFWPNNAYQRLATLWYHDHTIQVTSQQVYRGSRLYILTDDLEESLNLPKGEFDGV